MGADRDITFNRFPYGTLEWLDRAGYIVCKLEDGEIVFHNGYTFEGLPDDVKKEVIIERLKL
jgi:hypothetical protein